MSTIKTSLCLFIPTLVAQLNRLYKIGARFLSSGALLPTVLVIGGIVLNTMFTVTPAATKAVLGGPDEDLSPRAELEGASLTVASIEAEEVEILEGEDDVTFSESADSLVATSFDAAEPTAASKTAAPRTSLSKAKRLVLPQGYRMPLAGPISDLHGVNHPGVDIPGAHGAPIVAAADGYVTESTIGSWNGGYGGKIGIKHADGIYTVYAHLSRSAVKVGDAVAQGQIIGYVGSTGRSTGPHLHFEVRR